MICSDFATNENYGDFMIPRPLPSPILDGYTNVCTDIMSVYHACAYIPLSEFSPLSINNFPYNSIPALFAVEDQTSLEVSGITKLSNLSPLNLTGKGCVIGIIDSGIDYTHKAFIDSFGRTKIISIWDQTSPTYNPPDGFYYGCEYLESEINDALSSNSPLSTVPVTDTVGHGTMLAGVAAGYPDIENNFSGAATYAKLIVVKLKPAKRYLRQYYHVRDDAICYQENDIIFGISYIASKCLLLGYPLSLVIGLGSNNGAHNGKGILPSLLDRVNTDISACVSISLGNEGNKSHHYAGNVLSATSPDTIELKVGENQSGLYMEIWGQSPSLFAISIISPTGEILNKIPARLGSSLTYTFLFEQTTVEVNYKLVEDVAGEELILIRFNNPASGIWRINVFLENNIAGSFNAWLPVSALISDDTYFISSSAATTLTVPAGSVNSVSVGNYNAYNGSLAIDSSRGYNSNGIIKPDIASPGVNITVPVANNSYSIRSGSSLSAAITAGAVCQFIEFGRMLNPPINFRGTEIKNYIIRGATKKQGIDYPNPSFGYGTLDIFNSFQVLRGITN